MGGALLLMARAIYNIVIDSAGRRLTFMIHIMWIITGAARTTRSPARAYLSPTSAGVSPIGDGTHITSHYIHRLHQRPLRRKARILRPRRRVPGPRAGFQVAVIEGP